MEYKTFDTEAQRAALSTRLAQLEREHYDNSVALKTAQAKKDAGHESDSPTATIDEEIEQFAKNMEIIDSAYATVQSELDALPAPPAPEPKAEEAETAPVSKKKSA